MARGGAAKDGERPVCKEGKDEGPAGTEPYAMMEARRCNEVMEMSEAGGIIVR